MWNDHAAWALTVQRIDEASRRHVHDRSSADWEASRSPSRRWRGLLASSRRAPAISAPGRSVRGRTA